MKVQDATFADIVKAVSRECEVPPGKVVDISCGHREVVHARDLVIWFCVELKRWSFSQIARKLGSHHTTAIAAYRRARARLESNAKVINQRIGAQSAIAALSFGPPDEIH